MGKHYYEIWFYFYGENDSRTDLEKEYTFYIKTDNEIKTDSELINYLKENFPVCEKYHAESANCVPEKDYRYLSKWFEINKETFTDGCGVSA
jgi:hypothetical protein